MGDCKANRERLRRGSRIVASLACAALVAAALPAAAQDATWLSTPGTGDFDTPANWNPATVPTGTAFFGTSSITTLSFSATTSLGGWTFNAGASNYTFNNTQAVHFTGAGIVINGGGATINNNFPGDLFFSNTSTAGSATIISNGGVEFNNSSTAGSAIITNNDGTLTFSINSTAGSATILNNFFGLLNFNDSSTAGSATITVNNNFGGGGLTFSDTSTAGSATISNSNYGRIFFIQSSSAGSATITNNYILSFSETSTAGSAHITNNASSLGGLDFNDSSSAGSATIINNSFMTFNNTSTAGSATIANNNILVFNDTSTAGSATITNNEGLTFDSGSTAGSATITNTNTGELFFEGSTAGSASITNNKSLEFLVGSTAGSATITNSSGGTLKFADTSTAGSATITNVTGGTIVFSNTSSGGSSVIANNSGASLTFNDTSSAGGAITNTGTTTFNNSSTAGNASILNTGAGTLIFNDTSTAGTASIENLASMTFDSSASAGSATIGNIGPTGNLTFNNTSTAGTAGITNNSSLTFSNSSNAGSAKIVNNQVAAFNNSADAGTAIITNNLTLSFNNSSTADNATITTNSPGAVSFTGSSTGGNARFITNAGGTFDVSGLTSGGMTAGSIEGTGNYFLGGNALTVGSNNLPTIVSGVISDGGTSGGTGGSLIKVGSGTLTLAGANTYSGGTELASGTLVVGNNSALGSAVLDMEPGTALSFLSTGNFTIGNSVKISGDPDFTPPAGTTQTLAGAITGSGTLEMSGLGTLVLAAGNGYTGPTNVNAGTLDVTGSIASSSLITVASGAALTGTGTVGATQVHGTFAPGSGTPGTSMTIAGGLAFASGALYVIDLNPATSSFSTANGTASLNGTVRANFAAGSYVGKQYTILQSAGLGGTTFSGLSIAGLGANFDASLSYSADDVFLNLIASLGAGTPLNVNQQNAANAIDNFFNNGGALPQGFLNLFNLTDANLGNALTRLDGENATGAENGAFDLMNEFLGLMLDPFVYGRGGSPTAGALGFAPDQKASLPPDIALAYAGLLKAPAKQTFAQRWSAWGAGFGGSATTNGDQAIGSNNVTASTFGYAAGVDYHHSPDTVFGFSLAGGGTNWNLANALGTGRSSAFLAGLYGVTHNGPWYLGGALAFANNWFTTNRTAFAGDQFTARFQGQSYAARLEGGYRLALPAAHNVIGITPYAALQAQNFHTPAYSETDLTGGGFGLSYNAMNGTDMRSELGGRFDDLTAIASLPLILRAKVAWAHDWVSNPALNASFESLPGTSFTVFGAPIPHDSALVTAGAQLFFTPNWSLLTKFDGEFAKGSQLYAGSGTLRYTW